MLGTDSLIGQTISHYRIIEKLGGGGMGEVYRARDERLERDVAIKFLRTGTLADETARRRFRKEALALARLNHPNIATIYDFDTQNGLDFLVTEYVRGVTLTGPLSCGSLAPKEVARLGGQLTEGLSAAHEQRVIHCDLKPGNLRLTSDGRLKILDFGLAKLLQPVDDVDRGRSISDTYGISGTVPYMAPEQLSGDSLDARTDIYAAGMVLYEMATGQRPFRQEILPRLTDAILHQTPPPPRAFNSNVSPELERIILKCLEKAPEDRYQSAKDLGVDLRKLGVAITVLPTLAAGRVKSPKLRLMLALGVVAPLFFTLLWALNVVGLRDRIFGRSAMPHIESLAVLPLDNFSQDPSQDYFADGMTDVLTADLSQISSLRVISRTSVMQYKGARKPLPAIARELNVDAVVEGSVLSSGGRVRITAQLIYAPTDRHLWTGTYDRDLRNVLQLQSEVAQIIADKIRITLTPQEATRLAGARVVNPAANEAYFRGRYFLDKRTKADTETALADLQQAIELDPTFAPAYASLSEVYLSSVMFDPTRQTELLAKARAAALKALELDNSLSAAHYTLAASRLAVWDWSGAEVEYQRAIELNPSDASARIWYATLLIYEGRMTEADVEIRRAEELDPVSFAIYAAATAFFYYAHRYDEMIEHCKGWVQRNPNLEWSYHHCLGGAYLQMGKREEAIKELQEALKSSTMFEHTATELANALAVDGKREEALKVLGRVENVPWRNFGAALVHTGLGEKDEAFRSLERAIDLRAPLIPLLKVDPRFDSLHQDPRFQNLLHRMNLP